jgi:hypothetical protein
MYTIIPEVVHQERDIPQWVLPAIMHKVLNLYRLTPYSNSALF